MAEISWHLGTHLAVLIESYPIPISQMVFKDLCALVLKTKVAPALEGVIFPLSKLFFILYYNVFIFCN